MVCVLQDGSGNAKGKFGYNAAATSYLNGSIGDVCLSNTDTSKAIRIGVGTTPYLSVSTSGASVSGSLGCSSITSTGTASTGALTCSGDITTDHVTIYKTPYVAGGGTWLSLSTRGRTSFISHGHSTAVTDAQSGDYVIGFSSTKDVTTAVNGASAFTGYRYMDPIANSYGFNGIWGNQDVITWKYPAVVGIGQAPGTDALEVTGDIKCTGTLKPQGVMPGGSGSYVRYLAGSLFWDSSSAKYKTDILDYTEDPFVLLDQLKPKTFYYKTDDTENKIRQLGLIAEDVELVDKQYCAYVKEGELGGVNYDRLVVPLLSAVVRLRQKADEQQEAIATLKNMVASISPAVQ